jgi:hypothetical protein
MTTKGTPRHVGGVRFGLLAKCHRNLSSILEKNTRDVAASVVCYGRQMLRAAVHHFGATRQRRARCPGAHRAQNCDRNKPQR